MFISFSICCNHFTSLAYGIFYARKVDLFDKIKEVALLAHQIFFSLFDCSFPTFKLNLYFSHDPPQHCSQDQKVVPGLIDFSPNTEIRPFRRWTWKSSKKVNRPTLKKPKIGNFGRPPQGAKIFFQVFEYTTFFRTLRSTSGVKMKEIQDVYFFQRVIFSKWGF
jgi:hypothetical protein